MRNRYKILEELEELRKSSNADSKHFEKLGKFINAKNFADTANFIAEKINETEIKTPYQEKLKELLDHYQPAKNNAEAQKKVIHLLRLIMQPDAIRRYHDVNEALQTGYLISLNDCYTGPSHPPLTKGISPLHAAVAIGDKAVIELLIKFGATLDQIQNINSTVNSENDTLLHVAVRLNCHELLAMILLRTPEMNVYNKTGMTPLLIACENKFDDIAALLLNKGADPRYTHRFDVNMTPPRIALAQGNKILIELMLSNGYKPNKVELHIAKINQPDIYTLFREPYRERKRQIIAGSKMPTTNDANNLNALFKTIHIEDASLAAKLKAEIMNIYNSNDPILKPLLDIAILAATSKHESGIKTGKSIKILFTVGKNVSDLTPSGESSYGMYKGKNSVYVSANPTKPEKALASMLHELKHFADQQVYGNVNTPYQPSQEQEFNKLLMNLQTNCQNFFANHSQAATELDRKIYLEIASIFNDYKKNDRPAEMLVKVPETIGYLGVKNGREWLEKNTPELLVYYEKYFNVDAEKYLAEIKALQHLAQSTVDGPRSK